MMVLNAIGICVILAYIKFDFELIDHHFELLRDNR